MNPFRTLENTAVAGSLKLVRMPIDTALRLLPGNGDGPRGRAEMAVDQADATLRTAVGALLRNPDLTEDAQRRFAALDERRRAVSLREKAQQAGQQADERLQQRESQAERQRQQAAKRAEARRKQATRQREEREERAAKTAAQRAQASQRAAAKAEEAVAKDEPRARLEALKEKEQAMSEQEQALAASDEAQRLAAAAARAKEERKSHS
jgi:hypothetical protein